MEVDISNFDLVWISLHQRAKYVVYAICSQQVEADHTVSKAWGGLRICPSRCLRFDVPSPKGISLVRTHHGMRSKDVTET